MSCQDVRQRLLAGERPDQPAAEQARHLAGCADCRVWLRRLVRLEQQLPLIPVPPSSPPPALLEMLRASPPDAIIKAPEFLHPAPSRGESARQKLALAFSLAATLALFAVGWWAWPRVQPDVQQPAAITQEAHNALVKERLKLAITPQERVEELAKLADEFFVKARKQRDNLALLQGTALHFCWLVQDDLPQHAHKVPPHYRGRLKGVASRFGEIDGQATLLANKWKRTHPAAADSLRQIAAAAREAEGLLRHLAPA